MENSTTRKILNTMADELWTELQKSNQEAWVEAKTRLIVYRIITDAEEALDSGNE